MRLDQGEGIVSPRHILLNLQLSAVETIYRLFHPHMAEKRGSFTEEMSWQMLTYASTLACQSRGQSSPSSKLLRDSQRKAGAA